MAPHPRDRSTGPDQARVSSSAVPIRHSSRSLRPIKCSAGWKLTARGMGGLGGGRGRPRDVFQRTRQGRQLSVHHHLGATHQTFSDDPLASPSDCRHTPASWLQASYISADIVPGCTLAFVDRFRRAAARCPLVDALASPFGEAIGRTLVGARPLSRYNARPPGWSTSRGTLQRRASHALWPRPSSHRCFEETVALYFQLTASAERDLPEGRPVRTARIACSSPWPGPVHGPWRPARARLESRQQRFQPLVRALVGRKPLRYLENPRHKRFSPLVMPHLEKGEATVRAIGGERSVTLRAQLPDRRPVARHCGRRRRPPSNPKRSSRIRRHNVSSTGAIGRARRRASTC